MADNRIKETEIVDEMNQFEHTLDAPNDVAHRKMQIILAELGITDEDIDE